MEFCGVNFRFTSAFGLAVKEDRNLPPSSVWFILPLTPTPNDQTFRKACARPSRFLAQPCSGSLGDDCRDGV